MTKHLEQVKLVREHFDKVSSEWADLYSGDVSFYNYNFIIRRKYVLDLLGKPGGRVLDAGCGTGDFIPELLDRAEEVFALDFAEEMVEKAKSRIAPDERSRGVHFSVGDVCNLEFQDDYFDAIIAVGLIEYLADVGTALRQMRRVLKPGGVLVITVPNLASPFMAYETFVPKCKRAVKRALDLAGLRKLEPQFLHRHFFPWMLDRQLNRAGLNKIDFAFCSYGLTAESLSSLSLKLSRRLDRLGRSRFGIVATNYIVKAQKASGF
ncbi:MAG TPA: methyltransferase domain-containing protein [Blastocatellia bacterium]|nr:methyltransferase domain-containing protein [Blastocatellia bacterium]